jgi:putative transposase
MPESIFKRMRRIDNGSIRYCTFSCYRRLQLFGNDAIKDAFVEQLGAAQAKFGCELIAWVVMPEHVHMLVRPVPWESVLAPVLAWTKSCFAQRVIARWRTLNAPVLRRIVSPQGDCRFWERGGGHDRNIITEEELLEKLGYIHFNPVKRGLVRDPREWKWSSQMAYCGIPHPLLKIRRYC